MRKTTNKHKNICIGYIIRKGIGPDYGNSCFPTKNTLKDVTTLQFVSKKWVYEFFESIERVISLTMKIEVGD